MSEKKEIIRTSLGLRDALFDAIEKVRSGELGAQEARAIGSLAHQICETVSLEIEVAKLQADGQFDNPSGAPRVLKLGN